MMSSPAQLGNEGSEMTMNSIETPSSNTEVGNRSINPVNATSPASYHTSHVTRSMSHPSGAVGVSPSNSHSQPFNIESFDFGADFSLPTSLDELNLFQHHQQQQNHPMGSNGTRSLGGPPSNDRMVGSPSNLNFSPRNLLREQQQHLQRSNSRTQSPHHLSSNRGDEVASASSASSASNFSNNELHNLLRAVQSSYVSSQQDQQGHPLNNAEGNSMSISDMERYLQGKEQAERMQMLQTTMLRQQLEILQRQQASHSSEANNSIPPNINAAQLMQQFQQFTSQQNASTPTQQNIHSSPFQQQVGMTDFNSSQKVNLSTLTQYGLITPLSSGAFTHGQPHTSQPFVSPIHLPLSSQPGLMDAHRSYDPSYTPLESPAITPASVFSNIGSSNTTSQDFFSPLTSPALRPHVGHVSEELMLSPASPHHGPILPRGRVKSRGTKTSPLVGPQGKKIGTPGASPATAPTKSVPRKNRSTTAEARANRARPNPLVKPTVSSTMATTSRKRGESMSTAGLISPMGAFFTSGTNSPRKSSVSEDGRGQSVFPPLQSASNSTKAMVTSPDEGGASTTPSPIDLDATSSTSGKPMTPGSIMGIDAKNAQKSKVKNSENGKQVSFAGQQVGNSASPGSLQNILPGAISSADREPWLPFKSGGGGGGIESRRTSHKAAEQKRRDGLKFCFDELRGMLPAITLDDDAPGGSSLGPDGLLEDQEDEAFGIEEVGDAESARLANRAISKVALLRHSNEYLIRLKNRLARRDCDLEFCRKQVIELRSRLGYPLESQQDGILAEYMPMTIDGTHYENNNNNNQSFGSIVSNHMDIS